MDKGVHLAIKVTIKKISSETIIILKLLARKKLLHSSNYKKIGCKKPSQRVYKAICDSRNDDFCDAGQNF